MLIPTPEKILFDTLAAVPTIFNSSVSEKFGKTLSYKTVSALKVAIPTDILSWYTDLTSSIVYIITSFTETFSCVELSLNIICSPCTKTPVVCETVSSFAPVEFAWNAR